MVAPAMENLPKKGLSEEADKAFKADDPALLEALKAEEIHKLRKQIQDYAAMAENAETDERKETINRWIAKLQKKLEDLEK